MKKQDAKIKQYLNAYVEEIVPDKNEVLILARAEMAKMREQSNTDNIANKKSVAANKRKTRFFPIFASVGACCVALVLIVSAVFGMILPKSNSGGNGGSDINNYSVYYSNQLTEKRVSKQTLEDMNINIVYADGAVTSVIKLYSLKGEPVLVESKYRFINDKSKYEDVTLYAELKKGYRYNENVGYENLAKLELDSLAAYGDYKYDNGEYVTNAYIKDSHDYFLNVMSPDQYDMLKYIKLFFDFSGTAEVLNLL